MRKLFLLIITLSSFTISSCQEKMKKYEWLPTECAPENYPAEIYSGFFHYGTKGSIYIPNGRTVDYGWGENGSVNIAGEQLKEAPHSLELSWISYAEKKNYAGKFELDAKKIDSLFAEGYPDDVEGGRSTYQMIKVGMAPGGDVVVWLSGDKSKQVEIGHFKAKPIGELDWKKIYPNMDETMSQYIDAQLQKLPENIQTAIKNGEIPYDYWEGLRKRYQWKAVVESTAAITRIDLAYFNKERDFVFGEALKHMVDQQAGVIEELSVYWLDDQKRELRTEIKFDEKEAFAVFSNLKENEKGELLISLDKGKKDATVKLKIRDKEIPFKEIKTQSFFR